MVSEWNATVAGCVLCLVFSWFLGIVGRSQGVQFGKIGPIVGIVGVLILAGLAIAGPLHSVESKLEGVTLMSEHIAGGRLANLKRHSLVVRTMREAGNRPDKNHLPWEYPDGRLAWITKEEYRKLRKELKEKQKED